MWLPDEYDERSGEGGGQREEIQEEGGEWRQEEHKRERKREAYLLPPWGSTQTCSVRSSSMS